MSMLCSNSADMCAIEPSGTGTGVVRKRNMDKRRETSRCAARDRRGKEADIFAGLKEVVPLVEDVTLSHLDRIALLRVAATVCKLRKTAANVLECDLDPETSPGPWNEDTITECLDGFVLLVDSDASVLYITESVALYLGHSQTDMTGQNLVDFLHPADFEEFSQLSLQMGGGACIDEAVSKSVVLRMKSIISPRGRNLNMRSALYKPITFLVQCRRSTGGFVMLLQGATIPAGQGTINATASAMTKSTDAASGVYMTRHTCDMKISYISDRLNYVLKNELKSLLGTSFYDLVHPYDCSIVHTAMKELFVKGHVRTPYYRLLAAGGSMAWVMTEATTISHTTKGQKGQYVVGVHFVLGIQRESESLVVCTDASPAGLPVDIKKEVEDVGEYVGRQPAVIENDNYVPLFADDTFNRAESLRSPEAVAAGARVQGGRKNSYDQVLQWLFRDQPGSPAEAEQQCMQQGGVVDPTLASAQLVAPKSGAAGDNRAATTRYTQFRPGSAALSSGSSEVDRMWCSSGTPPAVSLGGYRSMASGQATDTLSGIPTTVPAHSNSVSPLGGIRSPGMFAAVSAAHSAVGGAAAALTGATAQPQQQYQSEQQSAVNNNNTSIAPAFTPIIEDLQWEEPDLSGLAPFVPEDDMIELNNDDGLPKDLQLLFSDLPDWSPAQPLVSGGPRPMVNVSATDCKPSAATLMDPFAKNVYDCYRQPAALQQNGNEQRNCMNQYAQQQAQQYWQPGWNAKQYQYPINRV